MPNGARAHGVGVGQWALAQREAYWHGQLTSQQVQELEAVTGWSWDGPAQRRWESHLAALRRYADTRNVAGMPPNAHIGATRIGEWCRTMRAAYRAETLPPSLAQVLDSVQGWTWTETDEKWRAGVEALLRYVERHGTADAPADTEVDGFALGAWVRRARDDHRTRGLSDDRVALLTALPGWRWTVTAADRWERGVRAVHRYAQEAGHSSPPQAEVLDGFAVGVWVHNRRKEHRSGWLAPERVVELEALPGWSWGRSPRTPRS